MFVLDGLAHSLVSAEQSPVLWACGLSQLALVVPFVAALTVSENLAFEYVELQRLLEYPVAPVFLCWAWVLC